MRTRTQLQETSQFDYSDYYTGENGRLYFAKQQQIAEQGAALSRKVFEPYIKHSDVVLDFGCGGGTVLSGIPCRRKLGVEINPAARQHAVLSGIECVESLSDVKNGSVNVAISHHVLEHIPYPIEALSVLREKIMVGGTLVLCLPLDDWRVQKRYSANEFNHHLHTWTPLLLGHTLAEAGYSPKAEDIRVWTYAWPRYYGFLQPRLPEQAFDTLARAWGILRHRRQLLAVLHGVNQ